MMLYGSYTRLLCFLIKNGAVSLSSLIDNYVKPRRTACPCPTARMSVERIFPSFDIKKIMGQARNGDGEIVKALATPQFIIPLNIRQSNAIM